MLRSPKTIVLKYHNEFVLWLYINLISRKQYLNKVSYRKRDQNLTGKRYTKKNRLTFMFS